MGLNLKTSERGVMLYAADEKGTSLSFELTPWEAICLADDLRGRATAHAAGENIGTHRFTRLPGPTAASAYSRDPEPFTEVEVARMICSL